MKVSVFAMPTIPATIEERRDAAAHRPQHRAVPDDARRAADDRRPGRRARLRRLLHHRAPPALRGRRGDARPADALRRPGRPHRRTSTSTRCRSWPSADDPIRISERIALLDQLTKGRVGVCFARGYQKRWIQILSQGRGATSLIDAESDQRNREIYDEHVEVIRKSWTRGLLGPRRRPLPGAVPVQGGHRRLRRDQLDPGVRLRRRGRRGRRHPQDRRDPAALPAALPRGLGAVHGVAVQHDGRGPQRASPASPPRAARPRSAQHALAYQAEAAKARPRPSSSASGSAPPGRCASARPGRRPSTWRCRPPPSSGTTTSTSSASPRCGARKPTTRTSRSPSPTRPRWPTASSRSASCCAARPTT